MNLKKFFFLLLCTSFFLTGGMPAFASVNDGIIALVNEDVITLKDLHEYLSMIYMSLTSSKLSKQEIKETMEYYKENGLEKLIDERLKIARANKMELTIRPEMIHKRIADIKKQYPSEKVFAEELVAQGMTMTDLRKKVLDQFKAYYAEELEIKSKVSVSPQEVNTYYQENLSIFIKPESVKIVSLFIPYENDKKGAEQKAQEALRIVKDPQQLAQHPKGFEDVATKFSGVSSTDTLYKGEMLPEVENILFKLNPNEISELVPTEKGIYVFQLIEKFPPEMASFEETKDKIYDMLFQKKLSERREAWLKKLREEAYIEIK